MREPSWFFPPPRPFLWRRKAVRGIFYVRDGYDIYGTLQEIRRLGGRPVRVLPSLGMIVGEFQSEYGLRESRFPPFIEHWEPDLQVTLTPAYIGAASRELSGVPWGVARVEADRVWNISSGRAVKVAVIDTGIADDHPAIRNNYRGGINILSPMFSPYDYNGHGTHIAGTIAGYMSEMGVIGVAPRAHLYAVKAFNRKGSANLSDLLSAVNWCIEKKMQVINMSFGMNKMSEFLRQAIHTAYRHGIVMVAAAGNQGSQQVDYPARYPETIGVTATEKGDRLASFSNVGREVDIAAPGEKISSAWLNGTKREMSGTSMAVPHVTGTVALLLRLYPKLTPQQIREILTQTAGPVKGQTTMGLLNSYRSIKWISR